VTEVHAASVIHGNGWTVTVGRASHVQPHLECLAYRVDTHEGSVCYSGDSGACKELVELARRCDVLIQMNHHLSGSEPSAVYRAACGNHIDNAAVARDAGVKTLVLTHMLPQIDRPGIRERIVHEIQQVFSGRVIWGEDLMQLTLDGPGAATIEGE
jgi:ribonuclease BN (tRNA processing enzyme)